MRNHPNKVLFSVFQKSKSLETNQQNHNKAKELLTKEGVEFHVVSNVYKDISELSFLLAADDITSHDDNLDIAYQTAISFDQESLLEICNDNQAVLHLLRGKTEKVGQWQEVSEAKALDRGSYVFELVSKRYFVVG
jgi:hypothetical protein